jgi:hypothetical protein
VVNEFKRFASRSTKAHPGFAASAIAKQQAKGFGLHGMRKKRCCYRLGDVIDAWHDDGFFNARFA